MIAGIVAAQASGAGARQNPHPGSLIVIDFVTGDYFVGDTEYALADVIDHPELVTGNGLEVPPGDDGIEIIEQAFVDVLATGDWTLVLEYQVTDTTGETWPFALVDATVNVELVIRRGSGSSVEQTMWDGRNSPSFFRQAWTDDPNGLGIIKIAATRTNEKLVITEMGAAIDPFLTDQDDWSGAAFAPTRAGFGGYPGDFTENACYIRRLIVWPEQADAALPGLSEL